MEEVKLSGFRKGVVGVQFLFVAFGATVLVPLLVGLDPSTALFTAGIGTLLFHLVTKGKVPIFLGSSFAFIAPIIKATEIYGLAGTLSGLVGVALVYFIMSTLVKIQGIKLINKLFPSVVVGPIIILIGISLSSSAVNMAQDNWLLAIIALSTAIVVSMFGKGLLRLIPIFMGILVGAIVALLMGKMDLSEVANAPWIGLPKLIKPSFNLDAILYMIPVAIAPVIEHIGDVYVVNTVANKDFVKDPGLHRTLLGDGLACMFSGLVGGPPVTTYSEVTGAMSITKVTNPGVIRIAAITAILFSLVGKVSALLKCIPQSVLGGIMLLLFGTIATAGVTNMLQNKVDLTNMRNIVIFSLTMTIGIGGATFSWGSFALSGIGLAAVVGVFLNLILPKNLEEKKMKDLK
ncbi:uracil-xanthine permease family protein [Falsiporphyromonas endometrii]|uniref:Uracil-xanthine permease family protein n=1 Tax=Falsiporphyromonas endometrii TaxID=1387297 RepID=A0ABV9K8A7_9PORP